MIIEPFRKTAATEVDIDWIVYDLISPGGWTFLVGETGTGKSMLLIQFCEALQEGKEFLGFKTKKHNCLYIQADSGLIEWKHQIASLAAQSSAWSAHQVSRGFLDKPEERARLHHIVWGTYPKDERPGTLSSVLKHVPFNFVIFDCLHAITDQDINTKVGMSNTLQHLDDIVTQQKGIDEENNKVIDRVHYILVHHPNAQVKRGATAGSGHKGFSDACSTKFTLGNNILVLEKSKVTAKKEIELQRGVKGEWLIPKSNGAVSQEDYRRILGV